MPVRIKRFSKNNFVFQLADYVLLFESIYECAESVDTGRSITFTSLRTLQAAFIIGRGSSCFTFRTFIILYYFVYLGLINLHYWTQLLLSARGRVFCSFNCYLSSTVYVGEDCSSHVHFYLSSFFIFVDYSHFNSTRL